MDARRLAYLEAMQIDVWQRRTLPATSALTTVEASSAEQRALSTPVVAVPAAQTPAATASEQNAAFAPLTPIDTPRVSATPSQPQALLVDDGEPAAATAIAEMGWNALEIAVRDCTRCALHATRTHPVFGVGDRSARWMIIGEAPGADEDRQGEPFVGRAGQLLNVMLQAIGLAREQVFIANILKSRPPNNRDPRPEEIRACLPYLYRQIELVNPQILLCVGRIAAQTLLDVTTPIGKLRGQVHTIAGGRPMVVTYHPAYLLRSPGEKRKSWADLLLALRTYESAQATAGARA